MYGNKETANSCDAMLCESILGAHGSTGKITPFTTPNTLLELQNVDTLQPLKAEAFPAGFDLEVCPTEESDDL